ncbi:hypothetical protein DUNSADRAFT_2400 [Dunaliella salina]|uniref:PDZ domain-containing protein n=1 Tax=Dunaliella salina TaxID=3046 RepID=A0ABQ7FWC9_DUNSA|nr:hypothetical protein DUNSADRAFT_2400 [Dunaliella salina]|eukprot:KAF5826671.1 hypothetical protein DUNSADRAFT_2400 [Dunaliella salina]
MQAMNRPSQGILSTQVGGFRKPLLKAPVRRNCLRAASSESTSEAPPASQPKTYSVQISTRQPAGLVFAQRDGNTGPVYVDEVTPGGQADKTGVQKGDVLIRHVFHKVTRLQRKEGLQSKRLTASLRGTFSQNNEVAKYLWQQT